MLLLWYNSDTQKNTVDWSITMNKSQLIKSVADKSERSQKQVTEVLSLIEETLVENLKAGERVQLSGFGTFEVRERAARVGRNPQTKEEIKIDASKQPVFKAGAALKKAIN